MASYLFVYFFVIFGLFNFDCNAVFVLLSIFLLFKCLSCLFAQIFILLTCLCVYLFDLFSYGDEVYAVVFAYYWFPLITLK